MQKYRLILTENLFTHAFFSYFFQKTLYKEYLQQTVSEHDL